jgi:cytochrome b561
MARSIRCHMDALSQSEVGVLNPGNTALAADNPVRGRHQTLTIVLHWLTALLVLVQIALGILHDQVSGAEIRRGVLEAHRSLGVAIWILVMGRLAWRILGMRLPPFPPSMPRWHQWGARLSEWGLYGLMSAQALTGLAATVLRGRPFDLFGIQVPSLTTADSAWATTAQGLHTLAAYALASLVLVHAGAAVLHRVIADDGVLDSMLPAPRKVRARRTHGSQSARYGAGDLRHG